MKGVLGTSGLKSFSRLSGNCLCATVSLDGVVGFSVVVNEVRRVTGFSSRTYTVVSHCFEI